MSGEPYWQVAMETGNWTAGHAAISLTIVELVNEIAIQLDIKRNFIPFIALNFVLVMR